jgi:hypothetical protein
MARLSMRARLLCVAGAVVLMTASPAGHPASSQGLNEIVRNLDKATNPSDAQGREDQSHRQDSRSEEGQYRRPTSEVRGYNRNGTDQGDYGDRRNNGQRW